MKKNTITSNALFLLLCLGLLMMSSCRKDLEPDLPGNSYSNVSTIPSRERIALLRQSFDGLKNRPSLTGNNAVDFYASLTPLWNSARYMPHTNDSVIYMPLLDPSLLADPYTEIFLTIRDRPSEDEYGLIVFNMDSAYYAGSGITPTLENFTGVVYQVTASGLLRHFNTFASGRVVKYCEQISDTQHGTGIHVRDETEDCLDGIFGPDCWDPNKGAFWRGVGGFFKGIWAGIIDIVGSQPGDPSGWMGTWFIGGYNVYFDPSNNTPGGGINTNNPNTPPASTWQYLNEVLDGVLFKKAARMAQKLCDQYGLKLPQESFWDIFAAAGIDFIYANEDWTPQKNFNEIALFENTFRELIYLKAIGYPLSTPDNSTTPAYTWLKAHQAESTSLITHYNENSADPEIINFHGLLMQLLSVCSQQEKPVLLNILLDEDYNEELMDYITRCDDIGETLNSRTCKESFNYKAVGDGFTCQVNDVLHTYLDVSSGFYKYRIPEMCIQVRGKDQYNQPLTKEKAAELTAYAFDNTRLKILVEIEAANIESSSEAMLYFKDQFIIELSTLTGGKSTSSIAYGSCSGNIPSNQYLVSPFGILPCIDLWGD